MALASLVAILGLTKVSIFRAHHCHLGGTQHGYNEVGGGGGGPEGGGPGCCTEVHGVNGVQGGGGDPRHTQHHTQHYTNTPRSSLQLYTKV